MKKIRSTYLYGKNKKPALFGMPPGSHSYRVTLRYDGRQMSVDYHMGPACGSPTTDGVLYCLLSDASGVISADFNFSDWCEEYGLESDRKSRTIFEACEVQCRKLKQLLGDEFDTLLYTDEDELAKRCA